jgi:spore germination cell wall hydrolase CwlJ-like protein
LNRVNDSRFPNTICEVVYEGKQKPSWKDPNKMVMIRNACQFSWYCDGKPDIPNDTDAWVEAQMIAWNLMEFEKFRGITEGATHYHATYVRPSWAKTLQLVGRIGAHIFYRWE